MLLYLALCVLLVYTLVAGLGPPFILSARLCPPSPHPPFASQDSCYCFLPFFPPFMLSHHAPGCAWLFDKRGTSLLTVMLFGRKINTSPLVWYGDKTVIILMLCLCGLPFSLIIVVSDVLRWYHCFCSSLLFFVAKEGIEVYMYEQKVLWRLVRKTINYSYKNHRFFSQDWTACLLFLIPAHLNIKTLC